MRLAGWVLAAGAVLGWAGEARAQGVVLACANVNAYTPFGPGGAGAPVTGLFSGLASFPANSGPNGVAISPNGATTVITLVNTSPNDTQTVPASANVILVNGVAVSSGASTTKPVASPDNVNFYMVEVDPTLTHSIVQFNAATMTFTNRYFVSDVVSMAVSPSGATLYVTRFSTTAITMITVATGAMASIDPGVYLTGLVAAPDGMTLYGSVNTGSSGTGGIADIDLATGTTVIQLQSQSNDFTAIAINGDGSALYVLDPFNALVTRVATSNFTFMSVALPNGPAFFTIALAVSTDNSTLWVMTPNSARGAVTALDATTLATLTNINLPVIPGFSFVAPCAMAFPPPPPTAPPPPVTVTPTPDTLYAGQQVTLTVAPLQPGDVVTWSLAQGALGSLTGIFGPTTIYTAPAVIPLFQGAPVTATVTNPGLPTRTATAAISLEPAIVVTVTPSAPVLNPVYPGQSQTLTAAVQNAATTVAVTWSIPPGSPGSITPTNSQTAIYTYSGPPVTQPTQVVITATSVQTPAGTGTYTANLSPPVSVVVMPNSGTIASGGTQQFTAQVLNAADQSVTWTMSSGSLTANTGSPVTWTAPVVSTPTQATITATSVFDNTKSATATFQVTPPPGPVTIHTSPSGLPFTVDGGPAQTAPQTLNLTAGAHTIAVATTQPGTAGTQYVFASWSDAGAASHNITVGTTAATYTATFQTQYQLTISPSPAAGGAVTPVSGAFYNAGAAVNISATANSGFQFSSWTGTVANPTNASTSVTMSAPETVVANFSALTGITIQTSPPGLLFTVDGGAAQTAPQTLNLPPGQHTIAVAATQAGAAETQYAFASWSDGGAASHTITVGSSAATYTATFQTQYQLNISASPAAGGPVTPASGLFYNAGAVVTITATPTQFYLFLGWTGNVANPSSRSTTVAMSGPQSVVAVFAIPTFTLSAYSANVGAAGGPGIFTVNVNVQTATWTAATNSSFITITSNPSGTGTGTVAYSVAPNPTLASRSGTITAAGLTFTITQAALSTAGLGFVPVTPCRVADTRATQGFTGQFGPPSMAANQTRSFTVIASGCNIPSTAQAYSLNVTVVPASGLGYLTIWPTGQSQPFVSTLNSINGAVLANAAIVPAGAGGAVSVFVTNATDVILDINGYFAPPDASTLAFYPVTPCRVADTRNANGAFGGPSLGAGGTRSFAVPSSTCGIPTTAQAYSLNVTAVPPGPLIYLTAWPTGQTQPNASTLNALQGQIAANAAIVPAGANGAVSVFASNATDVILDINGYFAPLGPGALFFYPLPPCRVADTRGGNGAFGGPPLGIGGVRTFAIPAASCGVPSTGQAFSLNLTVVPTGSLLFLSTWPAGQPQPQVSTLNDVQGQVIANAAIVPAGTGASAGAISVYASDATNVVIDLNGYFGQ